MTGEITIVTAFFDIGRGDWTPAKGHPHYLQRSTSEYIKRFSYLASLDNDMVIYTSKEFEEPINECRRGKEDKTTVIVIEYENEFKDLKDAVDKVQKDPEFQKLIDPSQVTNPEYWNKDYVIINWMKTFFVNHAIKTNVIKTELSAWIDFGYCRTVDTLGGATKWEYDFNPEKIHLFNYKEFDTTRTMIDVISTNDVHILGAKIVAGKQAWDTLQQLMAHSAQELLKINLIDDDQTLMLMSSLLKPEHFELHKIPDHQLGLDPFIIFKDYNVHSSL